jgi:hypothetical protein
MAETAFTHGSNYRDQVPTIMARLSGGAVGRAADRAKQTWEKPLIAGSHNIRPRLFMQVFR